MTIIIPFLNFGFFKFFLYSQKGVQPPQEIFIHQASSVNWSVSIWELFMSFFHKRQRKRDGMTAMRRRKLPFNWWLVRLFCLFSGLHYQNVVGWGDTKHLPSNLNLKYKYFVIKNKNMNVVVFNYIHYKFASTNLRCNLKNQIKKNKKKTLNKDITHIIFI